jgi:hypothetical protein
MGEQHQSPLPKIEVVNLKHLEKPLTKLIESVSKGVGGYYKPIGIIREAKAKAEANLILARANAEEQEIAFRAAERLTFMEMRRQKNIDAIVDTASKFLPKSVDEKPVDDDWMVQFIQQSQDISDAEMQQLWAKILAGEVSKPKTFSRRTLERVRTVGRDEAELFTKVCRTMWGWKENYLFRINEEVANKFDKEIGINAYALNHLKNIGLLSAKEIWYGIEELDTFGAGYFSEDFTLSWPNGKSPKSDSPFPAPPRPFTITPLTDVGMELATIVSCEPIPNFGKEIMEEIAKEYEMTLTISSAE